MTEMVSTLGGIREATIRSSVGSEAVDTSRAPGNLRARHFLPRRLLPRRQHEPTRTHLNCADTTKCPQVTVAYPREFLFNLLHEITGYVKPCVGTVVGLGLETHGGIVALNPVSRSEAVHQSGKLTLTCRRSLSLYHKYRSCAMRGGRGQGHTSRL